MKTFLFGLMVGFASIIHANPSIERWATIPNISSLQVTDGHSVTLSSEHTYLHHLLADGGEYDHSSYIKAGSGEIIKIPGAGLRLTIKVGESCFWEGMSDFTAYRLVEIHDGICVFEYWGWDHAGKEFKKTITISPYPKP